MKYRIGRYKDEEVFYDPENAMNGHQAIIGKSGGGKSTQAQRICLNLARNGETIVVIELHDTLARSDLHPRIAEEFMELSNVVEAYDNGISCPLLTPVSYRDGREEKDIDTVSAVTDVFARTYGLGTRQRATLRRAISMVFARGGYEDEGCIAIGNQLQLLSSEVAENIYEKMLLIFEHNVFRAGKMCIKPGKINIIRLGKFDLDTQAVIAEVLLSYIWRMAAVGAFKANPVYVFADECQNLNLGKEHALTKLLTEGRKFGVNLILATQYLINSSVEAQRILQAGLIMYFQPSRNKIRETAYIIDSTRVDEWVAVLSSLKQGEFVAVGPVEVGGKVSKLPLKVNGWIE